MGNILRYNGSVIKQNSIISRDRNIPYFSGSLMLYLGFDYPGDPSIVKIDDWEYRQYHKDDSPYKYNFVDISDDRKANPYAGNPWEGNLISYNNNGVVGRCAQFDVSTNDWYTIGNPGPPYYHFASTLLYLGASNPNSFQTAIAGTNSWTTCFWFKTDGSVGNNSAEYLYSNYPNGFGTSEEGYGFSCYITKDASIVMARNSSILYKSNDKNYYDDSWHFIALRYNNATQKNTIYIDGVIKGDISNNSSIGAHQFGPWFGGAGQHYGSASRSYVVRPFKGFMDQIRIFTGAVSNDVLDYLWNGGAGR